jgi:hypothetical protein
MPQEGARDLDNQNLKNNFNLTILLLLLILALKDSAVTLLKLPVLGYTRSR